MDMRKSMTLAATPLFEMAMRRGDIVNRINYLQPQINEHLVKLAVVQRPHNDVDHWKVEVANWLDSIAIMRAKPKKMPLSEKDYFYLLFDGPFDGTDYVSMLGRSVKRSGYSIDLSVSLADVQERIRRLHATFSSWLASRPDMSDEAEMDAAIKQMLSEF